MVDTARRLRVFVAPGSLDSVEVGTTLLLTDDAHHYLSRVRRVRAGAGLILFDGDGVEANGVIVSMTGARIVVEMESPCRFQPTPACSIHIAPALIKGERMDVCIQKLVELGVSSVAPIATEHTVVRLRGERADKRQKRYIDIARDAARQSGRATVPTVHPIRDIDTLLRDCGREAHDAQTLRVILSVRERDRRLRDVLPSGPPRSVWVMVGPEGGFSEREVEYAQRCGFVSVGLGRHVLRADTACIAVVAALQYAFSDLGG